MFEKFEVKGKWWLPENPERTVHGTLSYSSDTGAILHVMESFESVTMENFYDNLYEYDIINGLAGPAGTEITLYRCYIKSFHPQLYARAVSLEYCARVVFKGHNFKKISDIKFRNGRINYNYLELWMSRLAMTLTPLENGNLTVTTNSLKPLIARIDDNLKISLVSFVEHSSSWEHDGYTLIFKQKACVDIETSTDIDFDQFMEISSKIQQFFIIAINEPIWIQDLEILVSEKGEKDKNVQVFLRIQRDFLGKNKSIHPSEMPFSFDIISDKFEMILKNWFEKNPLLGPVFNLYFALQYSDKMYIEHRFLNLVSFLESYHRRRFDGQFLLDQNYLEFQQKIRESIPEIKDDNYADFRDKFIGSFKYGNELNLRKRLKLIYDDNKPIIRKYIKDRDQFVDRVISTRNYRTHFDKDLEGVAISDLRDYIEYNLKLKMLVEVCILKELGFGVNEIETIFSRNREYEKMLSPTPDS